MVIRIKFMNMFLKITPEKHSGRDPKELAFHIRQPEENPNTKLYRDNEIIISFWASGVSLFF